MTEQRTERMTQPDVFDLLVAQHARIRDLFIEVAEAADAQRRVAFQRLVLLLTVHEAAEEEVVHPVARETIPGGAGVVKDRMEEEQRANELLLRLIETGPDAPEFLSMLQEQRVAVLRHARAEERYEFNWLRQRSRPARLESMAVAVRAAEAMAATGALPDTDVTAQDLLGGPPAAMMERAREAVREATRATSRTKGRERG
jgi:Hemerythrin HHE cation binding domain